MSSVLLINPKNAHNVGAAIRACAVFGATTLRWTGTRVEAEPPRGKNVTRHAGTSFGKKGARLPREERLRVYRNVVDWERTPMEPDAYVRAVSQAGFSPVCVEVDPTAELLPAFVHPVDAVYVFGPEDSGVDKATRAACHRFLRIPSRSCLNLAAAVNVILYDRAIKLGIDLSLDRQGAAV